MIMPRDLSRRTARSVTVALLLVPALAGCSQPEAAEEPGSTSTSASASASASASGAGSVAPQVTTTSVGNQPGQTAQSLPTRSMEEQRKDKAGD